MSFPAYPKYRDSGVEWLSKVPSHWAVLRLKHVAEVFPSNVDKKTIEGQEAVRLCNYTDVYYNDRIEPTLLFMTASATKDQIERFSLRAGDTIITKDSETPDDIARSAYVPKTLPGVVCGYHLSMVRPLSGGHGPFLKRYFDSAHARGYFHTNANGLTRVGLGQYAVDNAPIALPPLAEQVAIAAFLDRETAKIDALIEEQRRLIALLKEKRQAVISNAVTKGVDPHAPRKDSGIQWLGEVPAHWQVKRIRFVCHIGTGDADTADAVDDGEYPFFVRSPVIERIGNFSHDCEAVLTAGDGAGVGKVYHHFEGRFRAHQRVYIFSRFRGVRGRFFFAYMSEMFAKVVLEGTAKSTVESLRRPMIADFWMTIPPASEQDEIITQIAVTSAQFDALSNEAEAAIRLLSERRAVLISAAVTGKIDVRGSANVSTFPIDRARARGLVATEIIEKSAHQPTFGRVKLQKIAFLAEGHGGVSELAGSYTREAAGPLDRALIEEMENGAQVIAGIEPDQPNGPGTTVSYKLGQQRGVHHQELSNWLGKDRRAKLDKLIADFADLNTKGAEAVATLYGVWNDALINGQSPSDDEIIEGFLNDWHPEKREKFRPDELLIWLDWMRRHGIVPTGSGPETTKGRLFV